MRVSKDALWYTGQEDLRLEVVLENPEAQQLDGVSVVFRIYSPYTKRTELAEFRNGQARRTRESQTLESGIRLDPGTRRLEYSVDIPSLGLQGGAWPYAVEASRRGVKLAEWKGCLLIQEASARPGTRPRPHVGDALRSAGGRPRPVPWSRASTGPAATRRDARAFSTPCSPPSNATRASRPPWPVPPSRYRPSWTGPMRPASRRRLPRCAAPWRRSASTSCRPPTPMPTSTSWRTRVGGRTRGSRWRGAWRA